MSKGNNLPAHFKEQVHFAYQTMNEPNKYSNRYVAFLDVLGFKSIVERNTSEWIKTNVYDEVRRLELLFRNGLYGIVLPENSYEKLEFVLISDSFIISIPTNVERSLEVLLVSCFLLQQFFLKKSNPILLRGGISKGDFFHYDQITFGPALVDAFLLESKIAKYPRIIIDNSILVQNVSTEKEAFAKVCHSVDQDGAQYIDYLKLIVAFSKDSHDDLQHIHDFIMDKIVLFKHEEETLRKYIWLAEHFNSSLNYFYSDKNSDDIRIFLITLPR